MRNPTGPVVCYVGAVLGVITVASLAAFNLQGIVAKAHRHWDADIDRIIAQQQEKKRDADITILARAEMAQAREAAPQVAAFTTRKSADDEADGAAEAEETRPQKTQPQGERKSIRRAGGERKRQQHFIPSAFTTFPKFAASAAATTTTLLRLR